MTGGGRPSPGPPSREDGAGQAPSAGGGPPAPDTMRPLSVGEALADATRRLAEEGIPDGRRDALLLLGEALAAEKAHLLGHPERLLTTGEEARFVGALRRRVAREPLQYIRGVQEFWGLPVLVGPGCLIPRPETEHLVEEALRCLSPVRAPQGAELGPGSGCVLMALARERPDGRFWGLDREEEALGWARRNTASLPNVHLARADLDGPCPLRGLDLLVSNPPYITAEEWPDLQPEVRDHEPRAALRVEGPDPLGPYRALAGWADAALKPGGHLVCELGAAQARRARALRALSPGLVWVRGARDLAGHLRVAVWQKAKG